MSSTNSNGFKTDNNSRSPQQQQQQQHEQEQEPEEQEGPEEEDGQESSENEEEEEVYLTLEEQQELKILEALDLPVHETSANGYRPARCGDGEIELHKRKEFTAAERNLVCLYATHLMGWKQDKSKRQKVRIAEAACMVVAYDLGYKKVKGMHAFQSWMEQIEKSFSFSSAKNTIKSNRKGRTSYTDQITADHPTYLHELYRHATDLVGTDATFEEIAWHMNLQSTVDETRPNLNLNKQSLYRWFKKNKGKEKKHSQKPFLTDEQKQARVTYANKIKQLLAQNKHIAYLDEKWFYVFSRRKTMKDLPRAIFEEEGIDRIKVKKVISRRHPIKTMFMGVITKPDPQNNFDGKIAMVRLSKQEELGSPSHRYRFSKDHEINQQIKNGDWRELTNDETYTFAELSMLISLHFQLEEDVEASLCYRYKTYTGPARRKKWKTLLAHEKLQGKTFTTARGNVRPLTMRDVHLSIYLPRGTIVEKEVNCDSAFMLATIPLIGEETRRKMPWVAPEEVIYLAMDNAGGHGTTEAVNEYTTKLKEDYNIEIIQQSPCSPDVNALDLGVWASTQSHVERKHRNRTREPDALALSVQEEWRELPAIYNYKNILPHPSST